MFADIRGFTTMSEAMEPGRVVEILNEYFTRVTDVIFDNGGTLDKYIGDAVMAVFGAPISKGNDAPSIRPSRSKGCWLTEPDVGARGLSCAWASHQHGSAIVVISGRPRGDYTVVVNKHGNGWRRTRPRAALILNYGAKMVRF